MRARLCVMISGSGRTLQNLVEATRDGRVDAEVVLVVASRECGGAGVARELGIPAKVMPGEIGADVLARLWGEFSIDVVALAGYLRKVHVPEAWRGRVVNIHPALLPEFGGQGMYGDRVHEAVIAAGKSESGCTVHLVDDRYDTGRILLQRRCPVYAGDTPAALAARVFEQECHAYPEALQQLVKSGVHHERGEA